MDELKQRIEEVLIDCNNCNEYVDSIIQEIEKYDNSCSMALEHIKEENIFDIDTLNKFSIVSECYKNPYFRLGEIAHHLKECDFKYNAYRNHSINAECSKLQLSHELKKELADLYILLYLEIMNNESFKQQIEVRLDKFIEKIRKE